MVAELRAAPSPRRPEVSRAADHLDHPRAGPRPGLPAAQAPRPGPGVPAVLRHRDRRSTPRPPTSGCTAALLLEVDPVRLARSRGRATPPTSASRSTSTTARTPPPRCSPSRSADVFSTARSPAAAARARSSRTPPIPLEIELPVLPCRGGADVAHRLFEPLGWAVEATPIPLDERFPEWGDSRYVRLRLTRHRPAGRRAQPALRAAAGARRVQALLAGRRRGRQAAPLGRRLAGRPPRARARSPAATSAARRR